MAETAPLRVQLIAKTEFSGPSRRAVETPTPTAAPRSSSSPAGRATRAGPSPTRGPRPTPATCGTSSTSATSRCSSTRRCRSTSPGSRGRCTHELIRHRHFSYSQLSQRYVPEHDSQVVLPPGMEDDPELQQIFTAAADAGRAAYTELLPGSRPSSPTRPRCRAAAQTGPTGRPRGAAERDRDPHRRHRQLPRLAALHRDAGQRARRRGDPRLAIACLRQLLDVAPAGLLRLRDRRAGRRHRGGRPARLATEA